MILLREQQQLFLEIKHGDDDGREDDDPGDDDDDDDTREGWQWFWVRPSSGFVSCPYQMGGRGFGENTIEGFVGFSSQIVGARWKDPSRFPAGLLNSRTPT